MTTKQVQKIFDVAFGNNEFTVVSEWDGKDDDGLFGIYTRVEVNNPKFTKYDPEYVIAGHPGAYYYMYTVRDDSVGCSDYNPSEIDYMSIFEATKTLCLMILSTNIDNNTFYED